MYIYTSLICFRRKKGESIDPKWQNRRSQHYYIAHAIKNAPLFFYNIKKKTIPSTYSIQAKFILKPFYYELHIRKEYFMI